MNKNEVKKMVPDVCVQHFTLTDDNWSAKALNEKAKLLADSLGTGLICWWWHGDKNRLDLFTSYAFKNFLDALKPGAKFTNRRGKEFTIMGEPYLDNCRMCIQTDFGIWFCENIYDPSQSYK